VRRLLPVVLLVPLLAAAQAPATGGELYGRVQTVGADGQPIFLVGAQVTLVSKADPNVHFETIFNILGHVNPRDVQENVDAFNALGLFNSRGRLHRGIFRIDF